MTPHNEQGRRLRLGISACLLGERVRYDGGHKLDRFLRDTLGQFVDWAPVCPEAECGLPTPRESMRLVGDPAAPRLVTTRTGVDHTTRMRAWAAKRVRELEKEDLVGFVFKGRSPSSGMERVRVYDEGGAVRKTGVGLFARAFMEHFPLLPVEEEGRLNDPLLRENFIERIFCLRRYRDFLAQDGSRGGLVAFQRDHKLQLMAHSPDVARQMGRLVAAAKTRRQRELFAPYEALLMQALHLKTTPAKNANVLQHVMGYFRKHLSADEKQELLEVIGRYKAGLTPLVAPITLMQHYVRKYREPYLSSQTLLDPHPLELKLRNHA